MTPEPFDRDQSVILHGLASGHTLRCAPFTFYGALYSWHDGYRSGFYRQAVVNDLLLMGLIKLSLNYEAAYADALITDAGRSAIA